MFSLFKRKNSGIADIYALVLEQSRMPHLYTDYDVPDNPQGRFQMIALHAAPYMIAFINQDKPIQSQTLFDMIFQDIEYSFREIGVGDLAVPKKMKAYMKDFNGIIHAHAAANADHIAITARNLFGDENATLKPRFKTYIKGLFA